MSFSILNISCNLNFLGINNPAHSNKCSKVIVLLNLGKGTMRDESHSPCKYLTNISPIS
jgi:hypothetical protein